MLELKNVSKSYGDEPVLKNITHTFVKGEVNLITGRSAIGKTTLLRIILGLEDYQGTVLMMGDKSAVFQEHRLLETFSGLDNLYLVSDDQKKIHELLSAFQLFDDKDKPVKSYSGGMKERLSIIRALLVEFDILVMDEPFKELDQKTLEDVLEVLNPYIKGKTVIMSSNHVDVIRRFNQNVLHIE